ncbi:MAG: hypothetical protein IT209_06280 [Armatimonadetes bacterium]|nr:hypothetical protein [Armatimonadota bacterium]
MGLTPVTKLAVAVAGSVTLSAVVLGVAHMAIADPPADATYTAGMDKVCMVCHKVQTPAVVEAFVKTKHPYAMQKADTPKAMLATFDEDSPIRQADVAYIVNDGSYQIYVDKDLKTLRGKWNKTASKWEPQDVVDATTELIPKHTTGFNPQTHAWSDLGVTCEACHGPGSAHAKTADRTKIGNPKTLAPARQAMICGQCHATGASTDGTVRYAKGYKWGSDLGRYLVLDKVNGPGNKQQYNEWVNSKHSGAGVTCITCHEMHGKGSDKPAQLKKPQTELCNSCHASDVASPKHPKLTPEMSCASCHMPQGMHTWVIPGAK